MIDSHCHLADAAFEDDVNSVVVRAQEAGLTQVLCILAVDSEVEAERAQRLAEMWPAIRFAVGLHPHQAAMFEGHEDEVIAALRSAIAGVPGTRAIGEIGLDYHYDFAPRAVQQAAFRAQIQLARTLELPVIIHTRDAEDDTLAILRAESGAGLRGVVHCFTGSRRLAEQALELGLYISFAGIVTFPKATELRSIVPSVPADRLLCETDSPYLAPTPYRGKRNEPAHVVRIAEELARLRDVPAETLAATLAANFAELFRP